MPNVPGGGGGFAPQMGMGMPNPLAMMMGGAGGISPEQMMMMPHMANIQEMEKTQLDGLLMQLLQMVGPDIANQVAPQGKGQRGGSNQGYSQ